MNLDIMVIFQTMIKLFIMLVLGFVLFKCGVFDEHVNKKISSLIVNVTSPLLIISSISSAQNGDKSIVVKLIVIGFAMYIGFAILGKIICHLLPFPKKDWPVYECMLVFANTGFMGYPVLLSIFDSASVFYCSMLHLAFSFFIYTYGVYTLNKGKGDGFKFDYKLLLTPGLIITCSAILIFVFNIKLPTLILDTVSSIGSLTSPLSMMMIGASLATYPVIECITDWHSYLFAPIRLFLVPFITMLVCRLFNVNSYFGDIAIIINGMPVASMVLMLATQYDANKECVTKNIIVTTVLSVVSIPIVVALMCY